MASTYSEIKNLHASLPSYEPLIKASLMPYVALFTLSIALGLAFFFSTLRTSKLPIAELLSSLVASALTGIGIVALFCTVGVYV